ncbi:MAG TPA: hypothetical protein VKV39_13215 [Candidatus Sulfotelmatobacter sp.]|nr:hypothetical protein [Candidatus Sulfotelmatobacter sp.]
MRNLAPPPQIQPPQPGSAQLQEPQPQPAQLSTATIGPSRPAPGKQGMSTLAKLGIVAVVIIFVGGAAGAVGLYYVAHRINQKIHQTAEQFLESNSDSSKNSAGKGSGLGESGPGRSAEGGTIVDACRLLSKEDVSRAIGVEIIRSDPADNGCSYIAKGDEAEMLAKHATAMTASRGADKKAQQAIQTFATGMFKEFQSERPRSEQGTAGEVLVFNFSVDQHAAEEQMRLNSKGLSVLGDMQNLSGIGDEAFASSDGMIMVRKGTKLVRVMYVTCPCGTEQVKPLAKKLADSL